MLFNASMRYSVSFALMLIGWLLSFLLPIHHMNTSIVLVFMLVGLLTMFSALCSELVNHLTIDQWLKRIPKR